MGAVAPGQKHHLFCTGDPSRCGLLSAGDLFDLFVTWVFVISLQRRHRTKTGWSGICARQRQTVFSDVETVTDVAAENPGRRGSLGGWGG